MKKHIYLIITISFFCYTKISAQIKVLNKPNIVANTEVMQKPTVPVKNSQVQKLPTASQKINPEHLGIYKSSISINGKKIPINIKGKGTVLSPNKYPNFVEKNINSKEKRVGLTEEEEKETYTKICKTTFNKLDVNSSEWDVISLSTINNVKVGSVFSLLDLQNEGKFLNIHGVRNPATVIVDAENITKPLIELNQPTENDIINAKAQLLNTNGHTIPNVKERTVISEIYDESVLKLHVGFDVISPSVSVKGMFDFSTNSKTEKFLMDYKAEAFTLGYIPKTTTFFQDQNLNDRSDLVYVDKLVYGTRILVAFETDFSNIDFGAKLEAEVRSSVLVNVDALFKYQDVLKNTSFKIFAWGVKQGSSGSLINATGVQDLKDKVAKLISELKQTDYYPSSWGLPISYSLRALNGETVVANAGLDELPQRNCILQPKSMNRYTAQITSINTGGDCEMFGIISMQCFVGNQEIVAEEGNGLLTDIAFNQALEQNKIYLPETHSGILGNSRVYKITNPNNTFFRIWTDINDRDVRPNGDDYLFITGGKCGVQVGNRQYCYQDFKVSDLIGRDMGGSGNICAKNKKIVVNSKDNDGDSPLQLQISVCQGY